MKRFAATIILRHGIFSSKDYPPMPDIAKALAKKGIHRLTPLRHWHLASGAFAGRRHIFMHDEFHEDGLEQKMAIAWHKSRGLCVICRPKAAVGR